MSYTVKATDSGGVSYTTAASSYLVFSGPVTSIETIQRTADGKPGPSPIYTGTNNNPGAAQPFDLDAVVQDVFQSGSSYYGVLQDDADLKPFTGIYAFFGSADPGLVAGDRIHITEAAINERYDVTQIQNLTYTKTASGDPLPYVTLTTGQVTGASGATTAEQYEGMLVQFDNVVITDLNADGDDAVAGFGEWAFSSTGSTANQFRADDFSNAFANDYNITALTLGETRSFIRGVMYFAFGNYKLIPIQAGDVGAVVTAEEGGVDALSARIVSAYPNPAAGSLARVRFELAEPATVALDLVDVTGRRVAVVADGEYAAAAHTADVDLSGLASGVYVLRLQAGSAVSTARLLVVR